MESYRYSIDYSKSIVDARVILECHDYEIIIVDLDDPSNDGLPFLAKYRRDGGNADVIILSGRNTVQNMVAALDSGADDYLAKPLDLREVNARLRALVRRRHAHFKPNILSFAGLSLDASAHEVSIDERPLRLLPREFALLHALLEEPGRICSKAELVARLYGWDKTISNNAIEVHISSLRRKIGDGRIETVRGQGYRINTE